MQWSKYLVAINHLSIHKCTNYVCIWSRDKEQDMKKGERAGKAQLSTTNEYFHFRLNLKTFLVTWVLSLPSPTIHIINHVLKFNFFSLALLSSSFREVNKKPSWSIDLENILTFSTDHEIHPQPSSTCDSHYSRKPPCGTIPLSLNIRYSLCPNSSWDILILVNVTNELQWKEYISISLPP